MREWKMVSGYVSEIYPTFQGEGPYTGDRQIFLRLAGCSVRCKYCDTPDSLGLVAAHQMSVNQVLEQVKAVQLKEGISVVSVTGGEPLGQGSFLEELLPKLKAEGLVVYLETAGVDPDPFSRLVEYCDIVSMDIKFPSATGRSYWEEHEKFLRIGKEKIFVKVVVEKDTPMDEMEKSVAIIENQQPQPLLIIQPVAPIAVDFEIPSEEKVQEFFKLAQARLSQVRVMPQKHKVLGHR